MANCTYNSTRYFFDCKPDCEKRKPGCHDHCDSYQTKRAQLDEINKQHRLKYLASEYMYDSIKKKKDRISRLKRSYPNSKFHH